MKCWNSVFNAQGSRVIIVVVQVGIVKIYVAAVELLRKKERHDETQFTTKIVPVISFCKIFISSYMFDALKGNSNDHYNQCFNFLEGCNLSFTLQYRSKWSENLEHDTTQGIKSTNLVAWKVGK